MARLAFTVAAGDVINPLLLPSKLGHLLKLSFHQPSEIVQAFVDLCTRLEDNAYKLFHQLDFYSNSLSAALMTWCSSTLGSVGSGSTFVNPSVNVLVQGAMIVDHYDKNALPAVIDPTLLKNSTDDGVARSMARRKKNAPPMDINKKCRFCDRIFKRPCDLTKHEKTHLREHKCPVHSCRYHEVGWPTVKEMERHYNDKHCNAPIMFKCKEEHCTYQSKRESNCKQHMEKAHGRPYDRSKGAAKQGGQASVTPASNMTSLSTPSIGSSLSPSRPSLRSSQEPPFSFAEAPYQTGSTDFQLYADSGSQQSSSNSLFSTTFDALQTQFGVTDSHTLMPSLGMDRQSMDSSSVPELAGTSMGADGSSVASNDNPSLDFESCWSNVLMPNECVPQAAGQIATTNMHTVSPTRAESTNGMTSSTRGPSMSSASPISNQRSRVHGLSPGARGNQMLYTPDSWAADEGVGFCTYGQDKTNNDFTLYENTATDVGVVTQPSSIPGLKGMDPILSSFDFSQDGLLMNSWADQSGMGDNTSFSSNMDFAS